MGIYDRDYAADNERPGVNLGGPRMLVTNIALLTGAIYIGQLAFPQLTDLLALHSDLAQKPWQAYQLLTYGFVHDPTRVTHVLFNMLIFWFLGRDVEQIYGQRALLQLYLSTIFLGGLVWWLIELTTGGAGPNGPYLLGASGGVTGVALVSILHYPRRTILFMFVIPMPIWVLAVFYIGSDVWRMFQQNTEVASVVHLVGAGLGALFFQTQWTLASLWSGRTPRGMFRARPKLRVHREDDYPEPDDEPNEEDDLAAELDRILEKIGREGEASLSRRERRTLEEASRRYQRRHRT